MNIKELIEKKLKAPSNQFVTDTQFAFEEYMAGRATIKDLKDTVKDLNNVAKKEDIERFINNPASIRYMALEIGCEPEELKQRAIALKKEL